VSRGWAALIDSAKHWQSVVSCETWARREMAETGRLLFAKAEREMHV
jgi:hypothetical protein